VLLDLLSDTLKTSGNTHSATDWSCFKSLRNKYHFLILSAKKHYYSNLVSLSSHNPKWLWQTVNNLLHRKSSSPLPSSAPGLSKICRDSSAVCMSRYKRRWQAVLFKASDLSRLAERLRQPLRKSRRCSLSVGNTFMSRHKQATQCTAAANYSSVNGLRSGPALSLRNCQASVPASRRRKPVPAQVAASYGAAELSWHLFRHPGIF